MQVSYNKVNGLHASENSFLLNEVLRKQWDSTALTMSDWFGVYSIAESVNAGLDLEMPGTNKFRSPYYMTCSVHARKITVETIKKRARKVLELVQKCAKGAPEVIDGDGEERTNDKQDEKVLKQSVAAQTIVLLKNEYSSSLRKLDEETRHIGGNAKVHMLSGGDLPPSNRLILSIHLKESQAALGPDTEVFYAEGVQTFKTLPGFEREMTTATGSMGFDSAWFSHDEKDEPLPDAIETGIVDASTLFIAHSAPATLTPKWTLKLKGTIKPREEDTLYQFGCLTTGRSKIYVDGNLVVDNWTVQRYGKSFFGAGTEEERGEYTLKKGFPHEIMIECKNGRGPQKGEHFSGTIADLPAIEKAVAIAKEADIALLVVGLNADWDTEEYDRTDLKLPGRADELIKRVAQTSAKTAVINQAGFALEMPWVDDVSGILHSWYLGNATGSAIADVLFEKVNPSIYWDGL